MREQPVRALAVQMIEHADEIAIPNTDSAKAATQSTGRSHTAEERAVP